MKYYFVEPEDKQSLSRRWYADENGLAAIKHRYQNYNKDPTKPVDRWSEFKTTEVNQVNIDFGGMISLDEPSVNVHDGNVSFKMLVSHLPIFVASLEKAIVEDHETYPGIVSIGLRWWNICISEDTAKRILPDAVKLLINCEEMLEGAERDFRQKLEEIQKKGGNVVSFRKNRKKKND